MHTAFLPLVWLLQGALAWLMHTAFLPLVWLLQGALVVAAVAPWLHCVRGLVRDDGIGVELAQARLHLQLGGQSAAGECPQPLVLRGVEACEKAHMAQPSCNGSLAARSPLPSPIQISPQATPASPLSASFTFRPQVAGRSAPSLVARSHPPWGGCAPCHPGSVTQSSSA